MSAISRLNVRVYGVLENAQQEILLVHEKIGDFHFTKFPGGGLEFGEGIRDCLVREFKEETGLDVEIGEHIYTTDFFQQSAFRKTDQLIAVYYKVSSSQDLSLIRLDEFDVENNGRTEQMQFFWLKHDELKESIFTFPIDRVVCNMLTGNS